MELLLMRHGDAVEDAPGLGDGGRWLSGKGRRVTRQVAAWLLGHPAHAPRRIWTSPLVRAVQTAEIVAQTLALGDEVTVRASLSVDGDPRETLAAARASRDAGPLLLVGHEPTLSHLAATLLGPTLRWPGFRKSAILAVTLAPHGDAVFRMTLDPAGPHATTDPTAFQRA